MANRKLTYILEPYRTPVRPISLSMYDAEAYDCAVVIQQLVGRIVYYSNQGKYEPQIAESWEMVSPKQWVFKLRSGFTCENGEVINASSFKQSLQRSIRRFGKDNPIPVFAKMNGYASFTAGNTDLAGLKAAGNELVFEFSEPVRSGLVQYLSFSQFGFISENNYAGDDWKDGTKFLSSGPYRISNVESGKEYLLEKRAEWPHRERSPDQVRVLQARPEIVTAPAMIDAKAPLKPVPAGFRPFDLAPEWLSFVSVGRTKNGFFSKRANRMALNYAIERAKARRTEQYKNLKHSNNFFFGMDSKPQEANEGVLAVSPPETSLVIPGNEPTGPESPIPYAWSLLKEALAELGWPYEFLGNSQRWRDYADRTRSDLQFGNQAVGLQPEPWLVSSMFCTEVGPAFEDISGRIGQAFDEYERGIISSAEFERRFTEQFEEDRAVIPIGHYGLQWYFTDEIEADKIAPSLTVIQFADIRLK